MWHHLKGLVGCFVGGGFLVVVVLLHQWVLVVSCGIFLCGTQASEGAGSVVAVLGLSCSRTCGILVPQLGFKPTSPALQGRFLTTGPPGKSLVGCFRWGSGVCLNQVWQDTQTWMWLSWRKKLFILNDPKKQEECLPCRAIWGSTSQLGLRGNGGSKGKNLYCHFHWKDWMRQG